MPLTAKAAMMLMHLARHGCDTHDELPSMGDCKTVTDSQLVRPNHDIISTK